MSELRSKTGLLQHDDGRVEQARYYYSAREDAPPDRMRIDPSQYATWLESDGTTVGIRRGTSVSVGASAAYASNYDALDWGN